MKINLCVIVLVLMLLVSCAPQQPITQEEPEQVQPKEELPTEPIQPEEEPKTETKVESQEEPKEEIIKIPNNIKEILEKGKTKLTSYSYNYKSPESNLEYATYIKGNKIKIILPEINTEEQGKFYNTIYLDTEQKKAEAYCIGYSSCEGKIGKARDLDYESAYIETPLDWLEKVTEATLIDERQVEGRSSIYIQTNIGKLTVESFYGFLYKIEEGKKKWEFSDASFNSVKDSDVTPP